MPLRRVPNGSAVMLDEKSARWIVAELERLAKKIDGASGFARNTKTDLAVGKPPTPPTGVSRPSGDGAARRFKITTATVANVAMGKPVNTVGTIISDTAVAIRTFQTEGVDSFIYAIPVNFTDVADVRWLQVPPPALPPFSPVKVTGTYTCGGMYTGALANTGGNVDSSDTYVSPPGTGSSVAIRNPFEVGVTTHALVPGYYYAQRTTDLYDSSLVIYDILGFVDSGTEEYQVSMMTSATQRGWDWVRAH